MRYPIQKAMRAAINAIVAAGISLIGLEDALVQSAVVPTKNKVNCCRVLLTTRPLICIAKSSFCSVGSIASLRKRALPITRMPSSSGITANALAWIVYARRLAASVREELIGQI